MARSGITLLFAHRTNPDDSIDSICSNCFRTIASSTDESQFSSLEAAHIYLGFGLRRLLYQMKAERQGTISCEQSLLVPTNGAPTFRCAISLLTWFVSADYFSRCGVQLTPNE